MNKKELRVMMQGRRDALHSAYRAQASVEICKHLTATNAWLRADKVFLYLPFGSEIDTLPLIHQAWAAGKHVFLPVCQANRKLALARYQRETPLVKTDYGVKEVAPDAYDFLPLTQLDFCLVPGLIFDRFGGRIGYGGGYYDRFLPQLPDHCFSVAAAFSCQILDIPLPLEPFDVRLTYLCSEHGMIHAEAQKNAGYLDA